MQAAFGFGTSQMAELIDVCEVAQVRQHELLRTWYLSLTISPSQVSNLVTSGL